MATDARVPARASGPRDTGPGGQGVPGRGFYVSTAFRPVFLSDGDKATSIHRTHRGCFQPLLPRWPSVICQLAE